MHECNTTDYKGIFFKYSSLLFFSVCLLEHIFTLILKKFHRGKTRTNLVYRNEVKERKIAQKLFSMSKNKYIVTYFSI